MPAWLEHLWIVRHGQSAGNVAADAANAAGLARINLENRNCDVPRSNLGQDQATAVACWFGPLPLDERPEVILASPSLRAQQTAAAIASAVATEPAIDERLREHEFGILDRLSRSGVVELHLDQAAALTMLGKFYHYHRR